MRMVRVTEKFCSFEASNQYTNTMKILRKDPNFSFLTSGLKPVLRGLSALYVGSFLLASCTPPAPSEPEPASDQTQAEEPFAEPESFSVPFATGFEQTPLSYELNALEPHIDALTMEIHYGRHAAAYAKNMNEAIAEENATEASTELLLMNISQYSVKMRNNAGGHFNHELFWQTMTPGGSALEEGPLMDAVVAAFGSVESMKEAFNKAAATRFGSGWAWLVWNNGALEVGSTPNQDNPLMDVSEFRGVPLLGIDVWEHAYYLNYQNKRADYIAQWWQVVDWNAVQDRFMALTQE